MDVLDRWTRHLRATGKRAGTVAAYVNDVNKFRDQAGLVDLTRATETQVRHFLAADAVERAESTVARRHRSLRLFFRWLERKGLVDVNPVGAEAPTTTSRPPRVLTPAELAALLGACADEHPAHHHGRMAEFASRRDTAMVLLLFTTGMTASEIVRLDASDVDFESSSIHVGRSGRDRVTPLLPLAGEALAKYSLARDRRLRDFHGSALWLGERGPLTASGLRQLLHRRCEIGGVDPVCASDFRRSFATDAVRRGLTDSALAELGGWGSARSVRRYRPPQGGELPAAK